MADSNETNMRRRDMLKSAAVLPASVGLALGATQIVSHLQAGELAANSGAQDDVDSQPKATKLTAQKAKVEWPQWDEPEAEGLLDVLNSGKWGRTSGSRKLAEFEAEFAKQSGAKYCLATSSGTSALITALGALGIGPGDEVLIPPYTFVATFNAVTAHYSLPVFVDIDIDTFQMDPGKVEGSVGSATRVLMPVHIGGNPADVDKLASIAQRRGLVMIEDACQSPLARVRGRGVGTFGLAGCFSFQASKNMTSGEGGAILTEDESFRARCLAFHMPGAVKGVESQGRGGNYRLTEFQAAVLLPQLKRLEQQALVRDANARYLMSRLSEVRGISPARLHPECTLGGWHLFMFRYDPAAFGGLTRTEFIQRLSQSGVVASGGYTSLPRSAHVRALASNKHYQRIYGERFMADWLERSLCPINDRVCEQAVWFTQTKLLGSRSSLDHMVDSILKLQ